MSSENKILLGLSGDAEIGLYTKMANRHGMIAGATGTGKTVTLKVMAEEFSALGVPVFLADIKGDLSGMCAKGSVENADSFPTCFWDVYGEAGIPLRATVSEMGPLLMSRILSLNEIQSDILTVIFKIADDEGLLLTDTKDLRAMLNYISENSKEFSLNYGNMSPQSLGAIIRAVIALEAEGGDKFFGEPAFDVKDWFKTVDGKGVVNILECQKLFLNPTMYSTFLLWMLSEMFETLPEAGDQAKPKMVFFFDEAHILFENGSRELLSKIEQVVKLIRSKGVGIYFITQNPKDIPGGVLAQLGNKIQHALRAYTPAEQKAVKIAAESFRLNPAFDTFETIQALGIGEALVSVLDEQGIPTVVERTKVRFPYSLMGPVDADYQKVEIEGNPLYEKYITPVDEDSAYEFLQRQAVADAEAAEEAAVQKEAITLQQKQSEMDRKKAERAEQLRQKQIQRTTKSVARSAAGTIGREIGKELGSSIGGSFGRRLGGNMGASLARGLVGTFFKS